MRALLIALLLIGSATAQEWAPDQALNSNFPITFNLHDAFGAETDADSAPAYRVYELTTATPILTGTLSTFDASNTDGFYNGSITLSEANGFDVGSTYKVRVRAVVDGVAGSSVTLFRVVSADPFGDWYAGTLAARIQVLEDNTAANTPIYPDTLDQETGDNTGTLADVEEVGGDALVMDENGDAELTAYFDFPTITSTAASNFRLRIKADLAQGQSYDLLAYNYNTDTYDVIDQIEPTGVYQTIYFALSADHYTGGDPRIGFSEDSLPSGYTISIDYFATSTRTTVATTAGLVKTRVDTGVPNAAPGAATGVARTQDLATVEADNTPIDLKKVSHTWALTRSGAGTLQSTAATTRYLTPGTENFRLGWDCNIPQVLPNGDLIESMTEPELVTTSNDVTIEDYGRDALMAKVSVSIASDATATDDPETEEVEGHWVRTYVTTQQGGGPIPLYGKIVVREEPE